LKREFRFIVYSAVELNNNTLCLIWPLLLLRSFSTKLQTKFQTELLYN